MVLKMFRITLVKKEDEAVVFEYLGYKSKGITLACYEDGNITGAVCFDIVKGCGVIEKIKVDNMAMKVVVAKSALNFLDVNNIHDAYITDKSEFDFYKTLGFKEETPLVIDSNYTAYLNLNGYFTSKEI